MKKGKKGKMRRYRGLEGERGARVVRGQSAERRVNFGGFIEIKDPLFSRPPNKNPVQISPLSSAFLPPFPRPILDVSLS
jgi:hypothetical protein